MSDKIFPKTYNCHYCKKLLTKNEVNEHWLEKDGKRVTKLLICEEHKQMLLEIK